MSGRKDIPPSRPGRDDGRLADDQPAWYQEQSGALTPDQPTTPLFPPRPRPAFGGQSRDHYQPDETAGAPPDEPPYQRSSTDRTSYQDRTSGYVKQTGPG